VALLHAEESAAGPHLRKERGPLTGVHLGFAGGEERHRIELPEGVRREQRGVTRHRQIKLIRFGREAILRLAPAHATVSPVVAGVAVTLAGFMNLAAIPHPVWFAVLTTVTYIPGGVLGMRVTRD